MYKIPYLIARLMLVAVGGGCLSGCHTSTTGEAEWSMTYGTTLSFKSTAQKVDGETAEAGVDVNDWVKAPIVEWVKDGKKKPTPTP